MKTEDFGLVKVRSWRTGPLIGRGLPGIALPLQRRDKIVETLLAGSAMTPVGSDHNTYLGWGTALT